MRCETRTRLDGVAADAGWSDDMLLSLICRWVEATGIDAPLVEAVSVLAIEEGTLGGECAIPDDADGTSVAGSLPDTEAPDNAPPQNGAHCLLIRRFADLSTAHLTENLASWLEEECARQAEDRATEGMTSVWNLGSGFLVWVPDPAFDREEYDRIIDPVLAKILDAARAAGAEYVLFDRDAAVCPDLPSFDW